MKEENIEYAIEYRKGSAWNEREGSIYKWMECKRCGLNAVKIANP